MQQLTHFVLFFAGGPADFQKELRSYGLVLPMELFDRNDAFKKGLDDLHLSKLRNLESAVVVEDDDTRNNVVDSEQDATIVPFPESHDVLLGKGRSCQEFPGNQALLKLVSTATWITKIPAKTRKRSLPTKSWPA